MHMHVHVWLYVRDITEFHESTFSRLAIFSQMLIINKPSLILIDGS